MPGKTDKAKNKTPDKLQLFGGLAGARLTILDDDGNRSVLEFVVRGPTGKKAAQIGGEIPEEDFTLMDAAAELAAAHLKVYQPDHFAADDTPAQMMERLVPPSELIPIPDFEKNEVGAMDPLDHSD